MTIRDNDNPFGIISFTSQSNRITTQESARQVTLRLQRTGGVFSRASVLVRSIGGGEAWQTGVLNSLSASSPIKSAVTARVQAASAVVPNQDYLPLSTEIIFEVSIFNLISFKNSSD